MRTTLRVVVRCRGLALRPSPVVQSLPMDDTTPTISSLEPANISTSRARTGSARTSHARDNRAAQSRLKPRESKYSLRLGTVEREEGEKVAREKGMTLADFIRYAYHEAIQRHRRAYPKRDMQQGTEDGTEDAPSENQGSSGLPGASEVTGGMDRLVDHVDHVGHVGQGQNPPEDSMD